MLQRRHPELPGSEQEQALLLESGLQQPRELRRSHLAVPLRRRLVLMVLAPGTLLVPPLELELVLLLQVLVPVLVSLWLLALTPGLVSALVLTPAPKLEPELAQALVLVLVQQRALVLMLPLLALVLELVRQLDWSQQGVPDPPRHPL